MLLLVAEMVLIRLFRIMVSERSVPKTREKYSVSFKPTNPDPQPKFMANLMLLTSICR